MVPPFLQPAQSDKTDASAVITDLQSQWQCNQPKLILLFCGLEGILGDIIAGLSNVYSNSIVVGCTTCGEIGAQKCWQESTVAMAIGEPLCAAAKLIPDLPAFRFEDGARILKDLAQDLGCDLQELRSKAKKKVLVTLTDGLSGMEDLLTASLVHTAPGITLVGGGAGDNFRFSSTRVAVNGQVADNGAVVLLLEPNVPFHAFRLHHYRPTGKSLVVTEADPLRRLIKRLDGFPATEVIADLMGIAEAQLLANPLEQLGQVPMVFGFHAGAEMYLRSIMTVSDQDLLMGGATEAGTVLHVMAPSDLVTSTHLGIADSVAKVDNPAGQILFNCGGRLWEANSRGIMEEFGRALCPIPTAGMSTYGEQFGPMQVNHTLTGLVFGNPDD